MHPTMMELLGEARRRELAADRPHDARRGARAATRRYRVLRRLGREHL